MLRIRKRKSMRFMAGFLTMAFVTAIAMGEMMLPMQTAQAQTVNPGLYRVAIIQVGDDIKSNVIDFGGTALKFLRQGISDQARFELIDSSRYEGLIPAGKVSPEEAVAIGAQVRADLVVTAMAHNYSVLTDPDEAMVDIELNFYDVDTKRLWARSVTRGSSGPKPGYVGEERYLAGDAVYEAAIEAVAEAVRTRSIEGVITTEWRDRYRLSVSSRDGVRNGSILQVWRNGQLVSVLEVTEASIALSEARVLTRIPGQRIEVGDKVVAEFIPSLTFQERTAKREGAVPRERKGFSPVLTALLGIGLVVTLVGYGGKKNKHDPVSISGTYRSADGGAAVYIPPGAAVQTQPSITKASDQTVVVNQYVTKISDVYEFGPSGMKFSSPVTITFAYSNNDIPAGKSASDLKIYHYDKNQDKWVPTSSTVDTGKNQVRLTVSHFSLYVLVLDEQPTSPGPPVNISITTCGFQGSVGLTWDPPVENATDVVGYYIYSCNEEFYCPPPSIASVPATSYNPSGLTRGTTVYFAVTAYDALGQESQMSSIISGEVGFCPAPVRLIGPGNNSYIDNRKPTLIWEGPTDNNAGYVVEVSHYSHDSRKTILWHYAGTVSAIGDGAVGEETALNTQLNSIDYNGSDLQYNTTYHWRVCALNSPQGCASGSSAWTASFAFTVAKVPVSPGEECALDAPVLVYPTNGAKLMTENPTFMWSRSPGSIGYIVKVMDQSGVEVYQKSIEETEGATGTMQDTYAGSTLLDMRQYSWQVGAQCGTGITWSTARFFTKWPDDPDSVTDLQPPTWAMVPLRGYDQLVVLYWEPNQESELDGYKVYRNDSQGGNYSAVATIPLSQLSAPTTNVNCPQGSAAQPIFCDEDVTNGEKYYYKLAAMDQGGNESSLSVAQSIELPLQRATLITPGSSNCTDPPMETAAGQIFYWTVVNGATDYYIEVVDTNTNGMHFNYRGSETTISVDGFIDQTIYKWRIKAFNDTTSSPYTGYFCFKKGEWTYGPSTPTIIGASVDTNKNITIEWTRNTEANVVGYELLRKGPEDEEPVPIMGETLINQPGSGTRVTYVDRNLPRGAEYYYAVRAVDSADGKSRMSDLYRVELTLGGPTLLMPPQRSIVTAATPEFVWVSEKGAEAYLIQVADSSVFDKASNRIWEATITESNIAFGDVNSPIKKLVNGDLTCDPGQACAPKEYFWRVASYNDQYPPTQAAQFSVPFRFYKILGVPALATPSNGASVIVPRPTFRWSAVDGAANYVIRVCHPSDEFRCSRDYLWEAMIDETEIEYAGPSLQNCIDATCSTGGQYAWQALALDENNTFSHGEWLGSNFLPNPTPYYIFTKTSQAPPVKINPSNFAIIYPHPDDYAYAINFTWVDDDDVDEYRFRLYESVYDPATQRIATHNHIVDETTGSDNFFQYNKEADIPLQAGRIYAWNVAAQRGQGAVEFDASLENYFITGYSYPFLQQPENNAFLPRVTVNTPIGPFSGIEVRFEWEGRESVSAPQPTPHFQNVHSYEVELLKGSDGSFLVCDPDGPEGPTAPLKQDTENYIISVSNFFICAHANVPAGELEAGERIYWRVRARDHLPLAALFSPDGSFPGSMSDFHNSGAWSVYGVVIVGVPPVILATPPDTDADCPSKINPRDCGFRTDVTCLDQPFYWSPSSEIAGFVNLYLQISDDPSFNNRVDFAILNGGGVPGKSYEWLPSPSAIPVTGVYNSTKSPLVNGTFYYWRVGICEWDMCELGAGDPNWVFSKHKLFYKRPQRPSNFTGGAVLDTQANCIISLSWGPGRDCQGNACSPSNQCSLPASPPNGGGYKMFTDGSEENYWLFGPTATNVTATAGCGTQASFTLHTVDQSGFTDYIGSYSPGVSLTIFCPPCPQEE